MERPVFDRLIHVPGPNPILRPGAPAAWDGEIIEACNVLKVGQTYYLYYHGVNSDAAWGPRGYRLGAATAPHPLGPWEKHGAAPLLDLGPAGSWEAKHVACAAILREQADTYTMWYSGCSDDSRWSVGLATADSPLGPWTKYEHNPIIEHFGYVGGVVRAEGKYYLYTEHPIGLNSPDQGPFQLAVAGDPRGPWEYCVDAPVLAAGGWGSWDDGGYSEAGVLYNEGIFHTFYGGTKWVKLESIGYAYSRDGRVFHKHPANPVIPLERCPDTSAFAEVHALYEAPLFYLYHTVRYFSRGGEDIGVQVLATSTPFRFDMPVLHCDELAAGGITVLDDCPPIGTDHINSLALTVAASYDTRATAGLRLSVYPSCDGRHYDTVPQQVCELGCTPGVPCRQTFAGVPCARFARVTVKNLDATHPARDVSVTATLGCV